MNVEAYFSSVSGLTNEAKSDLLLISNPLNKEKGEILLEIGEVTNYLFFLEKGIVKGMLDNPDADLTAGEFLEQINWFTGAGNWIINGDSYILSKPSRVRLKTIVETEGVYFKKEDFEKLKEKHPSIWELEVELYKNYSLKLEYRNRLHRTKKGYKKLALFEEQQPNIQSFLSQKDIAAFLNLTPTQLSRIRHDRAKPNS